MIDFEPLAMGRPEGLGDQATFQPYIKLAVAVVKQALDDIAHGERARNAEKVRGKRTAKMTEDIARGEDALAWVLNESEIPYSFTWCCSLAGINSERLVRNVRKPGFGESYLRRIGEVKSQWAKERGRKQEPV